MNIITLLLLLSISLAQASVVGISTHPLGEEARVLSAELTGYMSQRQEMAMGLRYTQEVDPYTLIDVTASGGQDARGLQLGAGADFALLREDIYQPRVSIKPTFQFQKYEAYSASLLGVAPTIRKGFSANGFEFFPFVAVPAGMKINNANDNFVYYASLSLGASMPFPGAASEKLLLSVEANMDMGATSDYLGCLVSWVWN